MKSCVALCLAVTLSACATNPVTGKRELSLMSEAQEIQIGREQDAQVRKEMGVYANRELEQYVSDIGLRLAQRSERPQLPWKFTVVDVAAINAFALPGGFIYIRPNRIDFYTAREGDTWQVIAERQGKGVVKPSTLAIMNGHAVNEQPRPGERVTIVVAG